MTGEPSVATECTGSCACVDDRPGMRVGPHSCEHDKAAAHATACAIWVFSCIGQLSRDMVFDVVIMGTLV